MTLNASQFARVRFVNDDGTATVAGQKYLEAIQQIIGGTAGVLTASDVSFTPAGGLASTDVQSALEEVDSEKQAKDATLTGLSLVTTANDRLIYATGIDTFAVTVFTAAARALLDDIDAAAMRTTLGLGTLATQSGTFSGTSSGTNTGDQYTSTTASRLIGRGSASGAGAAQEITVGTGLSMSGTTLSATGTGDVVGPGSAVDLNVPLFDGTTGKLIKDSGFALGVGVQKMLANVSLGSAGTTLASGTITACRFLVVHIFIPAMAASDTPSLQFNATGTTDYRYKWTFQAAAATAWTAGANTAVSTDRIKIGASDTARGRCVTVFIRNDASAVEKLCNFNSSMGTASAATQSQVEVGNGAWISAAATQITAIALLSTSNMNAGTQMTIYGWN